MSADVDLCAYVSGLDGVEQRCPSLAVGRLNVNGSEVAYCFDHRTRAVRLAVLVEVERSDAFNDGLEDADVIHLPGVLSCPPNVHHYGVVNWRMAGNGNACPICGRYA